MKIGDIVKIKGLKEQTAYGDMILTSYVPRMSIYSLCTDSDESDTAYTHWFVDGILHKGKFDLRQLELVEY